MATEVALKAFRGNASMCSCGIVSASASSDVSNAPHTWYTGDELGRLHKFVVDGESSDNKVSETNSPTSYSQIEAIAVSKDSKMIATGSNSILNVNNLDDMMPLHPMAIRCTLPISHIEFDKDASHLFASSKEPDIRIYSLTTEEELKLKISTSSIGVRTFSISPCGTYIAVVDEAANLVISKLVKDTATGYSGYDFVSRHSGIISRRTVVDSTKVGSQISWHPTELAIAVPSSEGNLYIIRPDSSNSNKYWKENLMLSLDPTLSHKKTTDVNIVSFSKCGKFVLSADTLGTIVVWDYAAEESLKLYNCVPANPLIRAEWDDNYIMFITSNHQGYIDTSGMKAVEAVKEEEESMEVVDAPKVPSLGSSNSLKQSPEKVAMSDKSNDKNDTKKKVSTADKFLADDEDDSAEVSVEQIKLDTVGPREKGLDKAGNNDDNNDDGSNGHDDDDVAEDDYDYNSSGDQLLFTNSETKELLEKIRATQEYKPQASFHISSTEWDEKGRRYLVWNGIGSIVSREEKVNNRIEIRFANVDGRNKAEAFPDNYGFSMAALSYEGAFFASDVDETEDEDYRKGSVLYYHSFPNQLHLGDANETFTINLPSNEAAVAVAAGRGWVATATSARLLRIFSSTGLQTHITYTKGELVCIIGGDNQLAVFYHSGPLQYDGSNQINVEIYEINVNTPVRQIANETVPLPNKAKLSWAGFEFDTGLLYIMSSTGMVSSLMRVAGWQWVPVYDSTFKKSSDSSIWPVTIKSSRVCYVLLSGESKPAIYPQPVVSNKPFRLPIAESKEGKDRGEAHNERSRTVLLEMSKLNHLEDLFSSIGSMGDTNGIELEEKLENQRNEADKVVLKMLQDACKAQRNALACDLAYRIRTDRVVTAGIKVANHFGRINVASVLQNIIDEREEANAALAQEQNAAAYMMEGEQMVTHSMQKENYANDEDDYPPPKNSIYEQDEPASQPFLGLSKKTSMKANMNSNIYESPALSRMDGEETDHEVDSGTKAPPMAANPFAKGCPASPPLKKKKVMESLSELVGSPSSGRKLNRQSSIAQEVRSKRLHDKRIL